MATVSPYTKNKLVEPITEMPLIYPDEDLVLAIAGDTILAFDTKHNDNNGGMGIKWHSKPIGAAKGLMIADGVVYCVLGNQLLAFDLVNGDPTWPDPFTGNTSAALLPPVASGDYIYLLDQAGTQYKVRKLTGLADPSWTGIIKSGTVTFPPIPDAEGKVLYYNVGQFMVGVDMLSGKEVWTCDLTDGVFTGGSGGATAVLISPPVMNDRNTIVVLFNGTANDGNNENYIAGINTDPDQPDKNQITYFKRLPVSYLYQQELSFQSGTIGDNVGFFVRNIQQPLEGWSYDQMSPYAWLVYPYNTDPDGILQYIVYTALNEGSFVDMEFLEFAQRHQQDPIFCSFLRDTGHALLASGNELQPAKVANYNGANYYTWSSDGYDVGLQMTAPPAIAPDGTIYVTGKDPGGTYYLYRFNDISLTVS